VAWKIKAGKQKPEGLPSSFVVLNIGATKPANRWTVQGFSVLAERIDAHYGLPCVVTGGREDVPMAQSIGRCAGGKVIDLAGRTTLPELASVIDAATAVVTCDTGPMHLAVALGKKVVALFGPSDPRRTGPYRGRVVRSRLPCAPCNRRHCSAPDCMREIGAEEVFGALSREIKGKNPAI
jgi:ADP-heptose:LPS heptosyltransferase